MLQVRLARDAFPAHVAAAAGVSSDHIFRHEEESGFARVPADRRSSAQPGCLQDLVLISSRSLLLHPFFQDLGYFIPLPASALDQGHLPVLYLCRHQRTGLGAGRRVRRRDTHQPWYSQTARLFFFLKRQTRLPRALRGHRLVILPSSRGRRARLLL